ncbi:MAG: prolyl oligopeptidase family serine peptidase [Porphyromonas sp.]|nr:prolyl oligopeptidase family serine peptidase [Porphyromonas sp.]
MNLRNYVCGLLMLAGLSPIIAQESAPKQAPQRHPNLRLAEELRYQQLPTRPQPAMTDSIDLAGRPYTPWQASSALAFLPQEGAGVQTIKAGEKSIYTTIIRNPKAGATQVYSLNLLPRTYTRGQLSIESNCAWELFFDGSPLASGAGAPAIADSIPASLHTVDLWPNNHLVSLVLSPQIEPGKTDTLQLRIGFIPERADSDVRLLVGDTSYPDLALMTYGTNLSTTRISPSGQYCILSEREYNGKEMITRSYLYRGTKRLSELSGALAAASWMPNEDKLYFDEKSAYGRTLYKADPTTGQRSVLAYNIPEGSYSISPGASKLIFYTESKGPEYKKTLDRFLTPDERMGQFRTRYFLSVYELATGAYYPITFGNRSTYLLDISSDDQRLLFSTSTPTPDKLPFSRTDYYELDLQTMQVDTLFQNPEGIGHVQYTSKAGAYLVTGSANAFDYIGSVLPKGSDVNTYDTQLFLYDRPSRSARALSKTFDRNISSARALRGRYEALFLAEEGDRKTLNRIDLASGAIRRLSTREDVVRQYSVSTSTGAAAYIGQSLLNSDRFYLLDGRKQSEQLAYDLSAVKLQHVERGTAHDWDWTAPDGSKIQGRYYLPANFDPTRKYPMLVYYYGGTSPVNRNFEGAYSLAMYASLGYVVYSLNPSGSTGYGQEFAARHINAWGDRTASEIIGAVKDFCRAHSFVNSQKVGCMGASYGGFMTQYLQTQTDIFAAAVSHAGITSLASYWGEGYWGVGYSTVASKGSYPWNNPKLYTEHSPLFLADRIKTPLMLIHGLSDTNVPVGESWQMFNALRILGKPVEFVGVYGEDHHILDPQKRYEWSAAIMAFFAKYLQDDPTWWDAMFPKNEL